MRENAVNWLKNAANRTWRPKWPQALFGTLVMVVLMLYAFAFGDPLPGVAYVCYVVCAYCLFVDCTWCVRIYKAKLKSAIRAIPNRNRYLSRYISDLAYKAVVSTYLSLAVNVLYVLMNLLNWIYCRSMWSLTLAGYYLCLTVMRFMLLKNTKIEMLGKNPTAEYKKYRLCAYVLLVMNFALIAILVLAIHYNNGFYYAGYLIYIMAVYAFYNMISAIVTLVKYRNVGSPVMSASKVVRFSAALISMLSLEMAMLNSFDTTGNTVFRNRTIGMTGFVISALLIATSCYMITHSTKQLRKKGMIGK